MVRQTSVFYTKNYLADIISKNCVVSSQYLNK